MLYLEWLMFIFCGVYVDLNNVHFILGALPGYHVWKLCSHVLFNDQFGIEARWYVMNIILTQVQ